ncbi:DUF952 domain-containing protein [Williamsia sp. M5A3_1d]
MGRTSAGRGRAHGDRARFVWVLFVVGAVCQYLGAAVAVPLFDRTDPEVVAWLRTLSGGLVLVVLTRPVAILGDRVRLVRATVFGLVTTAMNIAFYLAISQVDLGVAVAVEFIGPIAVAALAARGARSVAALVAVALGVVLVSGVSLQGSAIGIGWALLAGAMWAGYIVFGARVSAAGAAAESGVSGWRHGVEDLGVGLAIAGVLSAPLVLGVSVVTGAPNLSLGLVAAAAAVGVLSSAVPYVLDQIVLTRIDRGRFALMLSLLPATAVVVGAITLAQIPAPLELVGIALVIAAIALSAGRTRRAEPGSSDRGPSGAGDVAPLTAMTSPPVDARGPVVHLCPKPDWIRASSHGRLEPESLSTVGFIHLSDLSNVHIPADAVFAGRTDLVLLEIDPERVPADIVWEEGDPPHPDGILFPHLYGPLPVTAVIRVHDYQPRPDGTFAPRTAFDAV